MKYYFRGERGNIMGSFVLILLILAAMFCGIAMIVGRANRRR